ncbi:MAG: prepilin peptidase [Marinibacterium sp.]
MWDRITPAELAASGVIAPFLAWLCVTDIRGLRIPDAASLPLAGLGLGFSLWPVLGPLPATPQEALLGLSLGYGAFALIGAAHMALRAQEGLGLGDAKLLGAAGAWLGWRDLPVLVGLAALSALVFALVMRRRRIAFGPWLAGAFWILWVVQIGA